MSGDTQAADDDIPTLTDIVVPGRLRTEPAPAAASEPPPAPPDFVFDIDFDRRQTAPPPAAPMPAAAPPAVDVAADDDLPLPWPDEGEPCVVVAQTADVAPADAGMPAAGKANAEALLAELLNDIGARVERRIDAELELAGQRLRAALREELDRTLAELTRGTPPTA
jgi:hypothetical protein